METGYKRQLRTLKRDLILVYIFYNLGRIQQYSAILEEVDSLGRRRRRSKLHYEALSDYLVGSCCRCPHGKRNFDSRTGVHPS